MRGAVACGVQCVASRGGGHDEVKSELIGKLWLAGFAVLNDVFTAAACADLVDLSRARLKSIVLGDQGLLAEGVVGQGVQRARKAQTDP